MVQTILLNCLITYMNTKEQVIEVLFNFSNEIRYVAIYQQDELVTKQKQQLTDNSSTDSDKYEELLVNPALVTLARQRGNIDCGGLRYLLVGYGNFYQFIQEIQGGHISICLEKSTTTIELAELLHGFITTTCFKMVY